MEALPTLFVGVYCPLPVVEQRERERQERTLGQAHAPFDKVHAHGLYDVMVDTSLGTPDACAAHLLPYINPTAHAAALGRLWGS